MAIVTQRARYGETRPSDRWWPALFSLALVLGALSGCGYFRPASPEAPRPGTSVVPNYSQPDSTLGTVARAIADKGRSNGQSAYSGAFGDTTVDGREFHAFFDPQTVNHMAQLGITPPPDWDHAHEDNFYSRFVTLSSVPAGATYLFQWSKDVTTEDDYQSDTATLYREYRAIAILQGGETQIFARGFAALVFVRASSKWVIVRWQDREATDANRDAGELSMGERRLAPS